jgi:SAM-dependent methyltransferase
VSPAWRRHFEAEARLTAALSDRMIDLAGLAPGMNVLDVGSGTGEPAMRAARRVAPGGVVLAVDASAAMLQLARERADAEGLSNLELRHVDAQALECAAGVFDAATARWSLMYMQAPERALERVHRALRPGGRLVAAFWAEPERVEFATSWRRVLARFRPVPPIDLERPGVFRHATEDAIRRSLAAARFTLEGLEERHVPVVEVDHGDELVAWVLSFGGEASRLVAELPAASQEAWARELAAEVEQHRRGTTIQVGGVTRLAVARAE